MLITFPGESVSPEVPQEEDVPQLFQVPLDQLARDGFISIDLIIQKTAPSIIFDSVVAGDTDYWMGVRSEGDGNNDDVFELGIGTVVGTTPKFRMDKDGGTYLVGTAPTFYLQPADNGNNWSRLNASVLGATYISTAWAVRSQTYAATWNLLTYVGNTGSSSTRDVLALMPDGNMSIVVAGSTKLTSDSVATEFNGGNVNIWHSRTFNYVYNAGSPGGAGTKYPIASAAFSSPNLTIKIGPSTATGQLSLLSGSTTARAEWDVSGNAVFNESGASVDHRFEGDTDVNLLFLDGSADTVQVGAATVSDSAKFYVAGKISTSGELEVNGDLNHDGTNVGFYGVTPVARPSAYTQTYTTATRTINGYTSDTESVAYTGIDNAQAGTVYATVADLNALRTAYENLRTSYDNVISAFTQVIDDLQSVGVLQ